MGLYIQFQRRAIESLRLEAEAVVPPPIGNDTLLADDSGNQLYVAGVSEGIGTCSDVLGMDVLVLSELPTGIPCDLGRHACAYTVLVRRLTAEEASADSLARQDIARKCIELLWPQPDKVDGAISFGRTGKKTNYTAVV